MHSSRERHSLRLECEWCLLKLSGVQPAQQYKRTKNVKVSFHFEPRKKTPVSFSCLPTLPFPRNKMPNVHSHTPTGSRSQRNSASPRSALPGEGQPPPDPPPALRPDRSLNHSSVWKAGGNFQSVFTLVLLLPFATQGRDHGLDPAQGFRVRPPRLSTSSDPHL